jgi:hypothetical protein
LPEAPKTWTCLTVTWKDSTCGGRGVCGWVGQAQKGDGEGAQQRAQEEGGGRCLGSSLDPPADAPVLLADGDGDGVGAEQKPFSSRGMWPQAFSSPVTTSAQVHLPMDRLQ